MKKRNIIAAGIAGLFAVGVIAGCEGTEPPGNKTTSERSTATSPAQPEEPTGPATSFHDGTFLVGTDIEAGTYKTPGDSEYGLGCYWERASDDSGDFGSIIANEYADGPGRVTVSTGEVFKTSGDCEWRLVR